MRLGSADRPHLQKLADLSPRPTADRDCSPLIRGSSQRCHSSDTDSGVTDDKSLKLLTAPRQAYYAGTRNQYPDVYRISKFDIRIDEKIDINITNLDIDFIAAGGFVLKIHMGFRKFCGFRGFRFLDPPCTDCNYRVNWNANVSVPVQTSNVNGTVQPNCADVLLRNYSLTHSPSPVMLNYAGNTCNMRNAGNAGNLVIGSR